MEGQLASYSQLAKNLLYLRLGREKTAAAGRIALFPLSAESEAFTDSRTRKVADPKGSFSLTKHNILFLNDCFIPIYGDKKGCPDPFGTPS